MSLSALVHENASLQKQLVERDERLADREQELAARDQKLAAQDERIGALESQLEHLARKLKLTARERALFLAKLQEISALRHRHPFLAPGQGTFDFDDDPVPCEPVPEHADEAPDGETADDSIRRRNKPKRPARTLDTSNLPTEHVFHELSPEERVCEMTGKTLVPVGEKLDEEVEFQRGYVKLVVHHRTVYGLSEEDALERQAPELVAPAPTRPLEGSIVGPALLAWVLVQKYGRHLPLYRQESILEQHGLRIPRQTTCDWVLRAAQQLAPIQEALRRLIVATGVVQTDDTTVKCQMGKGHGKITAHLWTTVSPLIEGVVYDFSESREHEHLFKILRGFDEGVLVGDGYPGYETFAKARTRITVSGCWAHSLRKFRDALSEAPVLAATAMTHIGRLFDIEKEADKKKLTLEERGQLRRTKGANALRELEQDLKGWEAIYERSGLMGTACGYVDNQRESQRVFLDDARVPIHNNACEVAIRPIAVGRRNWLFAGSPNGGRAAATIYTLVESCKKANINPEVYLADVLVRVATHPASRVDELIPVNWVQRFTPAASIQGSPPAE